MSIEVAGRGRASTQGPRTVRWTLIPAPPMASPGWRPLQHCRAWAVVWSTPPALRTAACPVRSRRAVRAGSTVVRCCVHCVQTVEESLTALLEVSTRTARCWPCPRDDLAFPLRFRATLPPDPDGQTPLVAHPHSGREDVLLVVSRTWRVGTDMVKGLDELSPRRNEPEGGHESLPSSLTGTCEVTTVDEIEAEMPPEDAYGRVTDQNASVRSTMPLWPRSPASS